MTAVAPRTAAAVAAAWLCWQLLPTAGWESALLLLQPWSPAMLLPPWLLAELQTFTLHRPTASAYASWQPRRATLSRGGIIAAGGPLNCWPLSHHQQLR